MDAARGVSRPVAGRKVPLGGIVMGRSRAEFTMVLGENLLWYCGTKRRNKLIFNNKLMQRYPEGSS